MVFETLTAFLAACVVVAVLSFAAPSEGATGVIQSAWSSSVSTLTTSGAEFPETARQEP